MPPKASMLPFIMIVVITFLVMIAISSGRSNDPGLTGDGAFPHHVCTFAEYCEGANCSREPKSFVAYLRHMDGGPRLEMDRVSPRARLTETPEFLQFDTDGGEVSGQLVILANNSFNWVGESSGSGEVLEHYGVGGCEQRQTP